MSFVGYAINPKTLVCGAPSLECSAIAILRSTETGLEIKAGLGPRRVPPSLPRKDNAGRGQGSPQTQVHAMEVKFFVDPASRLCDGREPLDGSVGGSHAAQSGHARHGAVRLDG